MPGVENLLFIDWGGMIWDQGGNFSKLIDPGSHWGASLWGTWKECIKQIKNFSSARAQVKDFFIVSIEH